LNSTEIVVREAPDPEQKVSLLDLLIVLARRRRWIVGWTLGLTVGVVLVSFLIPNEYTAETVVLPPSQNNSMAAGLLSQFAGNSALATMASSSLGIKNPDDIYVSLFRMRAVEDAMIQRFNLKERYRARTMVDARKKFEKHASVVLGAKDGLIRIDVRDKNPKIAAEMANTYVDEYRMLSANLAITEAARRRLFFQQQLTDARTSLTKSEEAFKRTEQTAGVLQIDSQAKALIESATMLRAQIVTLQAQIEGMKSYATDDNPSVVMAQQQLDTLQAQLAKLGGNSQDADSLVVPKGKIPEASLEYIRRYRDVRYNEAIVELLTKQLEMAKLDEARQGSLIQVADVAVPPDKKSSPQRSLIAITAFLAFLLFTGLWTIVAESLHGHHLSTQERAKLHTLKQLFKTTDPDGAGAKAWSIRWRNRK